MSLKFDLDVDDIHALHQQGLMDLYVRDLLCENDHGTLSPPHYPLSSPLISKGFRNRSQLSNIRCI